MSTLAFADMLASVFVPLGVIGAVLALACAILAAFALARGWAGVAGGAIGVWIVGALLSLSASFAQAWAPVIVALVALLAALLLGGVARMLARRPVVPASGAALRVKPVAAETAAVSPLAPRKPVALPAPVSRPVTDTVRIAS